MEKKHPLGISIINPPPYAIQVIPSPELGISQPLFLYENISKQPIELGLNVELKNSDMGRAYGILTTPISIYEKPSENNDEAAPSQPTNKQNTTYIPHHFFLQQSADPGNATLVKQYLLYIDAGKNRDFLSIMNSLATLEQTSFNTALNQLHPALFAAFELSNLDENTLINSLISSQRLCKQRNDIPKGKRVFWVSPFGSFTTIDAYQQLRGYNTKGVGCMLGYDQCLRKKRLLGITLGYMYDALKWSELAGITAIQKIFGGIYGKYAHKWITFDGAFVGGSNIYDTTRNINFGSIHRKAKSNHIGYFASPYLGWAVHLYSRSVLFHLFGNFEYSYLYQSRYTERDAACLNLTMIPKSSSLFQFELGGKASKAIVVEKESIRSYVALSWVRKGNTRGGIYSAKFIDFQDEEHVLAVESFRKSKNALSVQIGTEYVRHAFSFSTGYIGQFAKDYIVNQIEGKLQWTF